jgi:hypothetical protein
MKREKYTASRRWQPEIGGRSGCRHSIVRFGGENNKRRLVCFFKEA